jgi:lysophospholipid acyltransferase (LPLAT)-like uncharacterized protein
MQKPKYYANRFIGLVLRAVVALIFRTLRVDVHGLDAFQERLKKKSPLIIALWHSQLFLLGPILDTYAKGSLFSVLISKSRDGNIPSFFAKTYPQADVIRVGHKTRHVALLDALQAIEHGKILVVTPDGPKGPMHVVKPGVIFSAQKAQADVIALSWHVSKSYRCNSWDKFCIPLPFSKLNISFSPAYSLTHVSEDDAKKMLKDALEISLHP